MFLKYIIVHDLQTRQKFYFICDDWLAVEKSDGKIERELFVACEPQKTELNYLLKKNAQHNIKDSHVWYSIFNRPDNSSFTRLYRVTCCFVLIYLTMLLNIIYYTSSDDVGSTRVLNIGFLDITLQHVK